MTLTKSKGGLIFLIAVFLIIPVFAHSYCGLKAGVTMTALKLHLYLSPFTILFFLFSYAIYKSLNNRLVTSDSGLLVEDFSKIEFPWKEIKRVSTKIQILPRGGTSLLLVLKTNCDGEYASSKIRKLNRLIGIDGIPVCNLANYSGDVDGFLEVIKQRAGNA